MCSFDGGADLVELGWNIRLIRCSLVAGDVELLELGRTVVVVDDVELLKLGRGTVDVVPFVGER